MEKGNFKIGDYITVSRNWSGEGPVIIVAKEFVEGVEIVFQEDGSTEIHLKESASEQLRGTRIPENLRTTRVTSFCNSCGH